MVLHKLENVSISFTNDSYSLSGHAQGKKCYFFIQMESFTINLLNNTTDLTLYNFLFKYFFWDRYRQLQFFCTTHYMNTVYNLYSKNLKGCRYI